MSILQWRLAQFLVVSTILLAPRALSAAPEPLAAFQCTERLGIDWARTLVTYRISLRAGLLRDTSVRLVDAEEKEHPCQLWNVERHKDQSIASARASFMAELPANGAFAYRLLPGRAAATDPQLRAVNEGGFLTLQNSAVAVRLPAAGQTAFDKPLRFGRDHAEMLKLYGRQASQGVVPGPIQGLRLADGRFVGGSYFKSADPGRAPKVSAVTCEVTEQGPVFVEAKVRYAMDNNGFYQMTARLLANDPAVRIDEQTDLGATFPPEESLRVVMSLAAPAGGFKPDYAFWCGARIPDRDESFNQLLAHRGFEVEPYPSPGFGHRQLGFDQAGKVFDLDAWYPWQPLAHYLGVVDSQSLARLPIVPLPESRPKAAQGGTKSPADRPQPRPGGPRSNNCPFVAVVPQHAGTWRSMHFWFRLPQQSPELHTEPGGDVSVHWPLCAQPHPNTMLHTGEYDPALPLTYLRRLWLLVGGPMQYHETLYPLRRFEGYVNLDNYKDWILQWPADARLTHPRLVIRREDLGRLAPRLPSLAGGELLSTFFYFNKDPDAQQKRLKQLWKGLIHEGPWSGPWGQARHSIIRPGDPPLFWHSSYRQTQMAGWANNADEVLALPSLDPEQRARLRSDIAALCYAISEPDFNPRGAMVHLGNPNMPINRFCALPFAAALIPDHPMAKTWLDVSAEYLRYKLSMNVAPGGAWGELITYYGASAPHVMQAACVLGNSGRLDQSTARLTLLPALFPVSLLSPVDPRFGTRTLSNWGHEGSDLQSHWLVAAGLARQVDAEWAKALIWAWDQLGRPMTGHHDAGFSERAVMHADLLAQLPKGYVPKLLQSAWWPGFGAVLRAHPGDPNETYFSYRQGYMTSHCDANQGDFVLYAKGAPLSTLSLFGYIIHGDSPSAKLNQEFGWHSRVRFGAQNDNGGWPGGGPLSAVHAHSFSDSVDYLLGLGDYGPQRWSRQVLLLKGKTAAGPNYFVFRDSFHNQQGDPPKLQRKWWYLKTLGTKDQVRAAASELNYASRFGPRLNVRFLQPAAIQAESREATHAGPMYNQAAINWKRAAALGAKDTKENADKPSNSVRVEETHTVTAVGPIAPGQDILVVLYPQGPNEAPPRYELLADGAARLTTTEGTDYVFASRTPMAFEQGDVAFQGVAGAVRVYPAEVHLVVAEGPGSVTYKGLTLRSSVPATRVIPLAQTAQKRVIDVQAPASDIAMTLDPGAGTIQDLAPGVKRQQRATGPAFQFDSAETIHYVANEIEFLGRRGGLVVDGKAKTVRLVLADGWKISHGKAVVQQWTPGPVDVTFHADHLAGRTAGLARMLHLSRPSDLDRLPVLLLDGQTFGPGTHEDTLMVPAMAGEHKFEVRALAQPPVFRTWQHW